MYTTIPPAYLLICVLCGSGETFVQRACGLFVELLAIQGNDIVIRPAQSQQHTLNFDGRPNAMKSLYVLIDYPSCFLVILLSLALYN